MRSLTWTQAVQYFVMALACVLTAAFVLNREPAADIAIVDYLGTLVAAFPTESRTASIGFALSLFVTALGTASFPHLLMRVLAMRPFGGTGASIFWNVFFAAILLLAALVLADLLSAATGATANGPLGNLVAHLSGLPAVLIGLVFAGVIAALFAVGQAVLFAAASSLSHDVWDEIVDKSGAEGRRIIVARFIVVAVAWSAATIAEAWTLTVPALVEWAFALAAAGAFIPLLLGLWWGRCTNIGALVGGLAGLGLAGLMFLMGQGMIRAALVSEGWIGLGAPAAATAGMTAALVATIGVSLITPPSRAAREGGHGGTPIRERPA
jgi:cation/acetate symporter